MIAVAVVGFLIGGAISGVRLKRRHDYFAARAEHHARIEAVFSSWGKTSLTRSRSIQAELSRNRDYHAAMAHKYRHAARYPWLPVEPDQEEPEWPPYELVPQSR
jgi:hypothetical protein